MKRLITILLMALTMVVSMHAADEVNINLSVSPAGAASYEGGGVHAVGSTVTITARGRTGFEFVGWYEGETLVSDRSSFEYTVPNRNVNLVARFNYTPEVPDGPGEGGVALRRELLLKCRPDNCCTFNAVTRYVDEGQETELVAWGRAGFVFRHWEDAKGRVISEKDRFSYTMPKGAPESTTLTAVYEYAPEAPVSPRRNYLDLATGNAIIDDFTEGRLSDAISELINREFGNTESITMLTIVGRISSNDYGIARYYSQCTLVDLSRTTGCDEVPSYVYDGNTSLEYIVLPASTKSIGAYAFRNVANLREIKCFATLPPALDRSSFEGMPEGVIVRVPQNSVALYQAAEGWSNLTILPLEEDVRKVSFQCYDYPNCTLSLVQEKSGLATSLLTKNGQSLYTFCDQPRNTSYYIRINANDALHSLYYQTKPFRLEDEDITIKHNDGTKDVENHPMTISIEYSNTSHYGNISYIPCWYGKPEGSDEYVYLSRGSRIEGIVKGTPLRVHFDIDADHLVFVEPIDDIEFTASESHVKVPGKLRATTQVYGYVHDSEGKGIDFADVSVTYKLENGMTYTRSTFSNSSHHGPRDYKYSLEFPSVPFELKVAAKGYLSQTLVCEKNEGQYDFVLCEPTGATIHLRRTLTDTSGNTENWKQSYAQPNYTLERIDAAGNVTPIVDYCTQAVEGGLDLRLDRDAVQAGDKVRISGEIAGCAKATAVATVVAAEDNAKNLEASASLDFKQYGGVTMSYDNAENSAVYALLYNEDDVLDVKVLCQDNAATFTGLPDGRYTIVTMGIQSLIGVAGSNGSAQPTPSRLQQFAETGLTEGRNYVKATVDVKAGAVEEVHFPTIPKQPDVVYAFVNPESSFVANKSEVVVGNYLTLSATFDFKPVFAERVGNVRFIIDLPSGSNLVGNSVMVGNNLSDYICDGQRLIVPLKPEQVGQKVRFVVIPTQSGNYSPAGMAAFELAGQETMQYIGQAFFRVEDLSINVPSNVSRTNFTVTGLAAKNAMVEIYDDYTLIGSATALANGRYSANCNLIDPRSGTNHSIWALVKTEDGTQMKSVTSRLFYDKFAIELSKVRMFNTAHTALNLDLYEYETVFDFINPKPEAGTYWYWPNYPEFTFLVDFTWQGEPIGAAQASLVGDLILEVYMSDGTYMSLYPLFDSTQGTFVVKEEFGASNLPVSVRVFYKDYAISKFDKGRLEDDVVDVERLFAELNSSLEALNSVYGDGPTNAEEADAIHEALAAKLKELGYYDESFDNIDTSDVDEFFANMTLEEQDAYIEQLHAKLQNSRQNLRAAFQMPLRVDADGWVTMNDSVRCLYSDTKSLNEATLLADGFFKVETTDGGYVFMRDSIDVESIPGRQVWICSYVDFAADRYVEIRTTSPLGSSLRSPALRAEGQSFTEIVSDYYGKVQECVKWINYVADDLVAKSMKPVSELQKLLSGYLLDQKNITSIINNYKGSKWSLTYIGLKVDKAAADLAVTSTKVAKKIAEKACKKILGLFAVADVIKTAYDLNKTIASIANMYGDIPEPCPDDQENARAAQSRCVHFLVTNVSKGIADITASVTSAVEIIGGLFFAVESAGASLTVSGLGLATKVVQFAANIWLDDLLKEWEADIKVDISNLKCHKKCEDTPGAKCCKPGQQCPPPDCPPGTKDCCPPPKDPKVITGCSSGGDKGGGGKGGNGGGNTGGGNTGGGNSGGGGSDGGTFAGYPSFPGGFSGGWFSGWGDSGQGGNAKSVMDPSGFVYEATLANRVAGATATVFERVSTEDMYGDIHTEVVVWDATPYAQQNPLFTDEAGMYAWDVPEGLWQVRIEKTGYEPAQSAWLPVPPPQLEVNIPLRNLSQPQVDEVKAYDTGVVIDFSKYMKASTLSVSGPAGTIDGATVLVSRDGKYIDGTLELVAPEEDAETAEPLARRIRFVPATKFPAGTVTLTVTPDVRCYANIPMAEVFQQTFTVEAEPKQFVCDDLVLLERGASRSVTVQVVPASAAKGRQVRVHMASRTLAAITGALDGELLLTPDAQGRVTFEVSSMLPGNTAIDVTLPGTDLRTVIDVNVMDIFPGDVAAPVATIPTNSELDPGTGVQLYCMTPDVKIYYTLDGSCPCTNIAGRVLYDGTPIVITETTTLKALAIAPDNTESAIASFFYYVFDPASVSAPLQEKRPAVHYGIDGVRRNTTQHHGVYITGGRKQVVR